VLTAIQGTTHALTSTTVTANGMFRLASFAMTLKRSVRLQGRVTAMELGWLDPRNATNARIVSQNAPNGM